MKMLPSLDDLDNKAWGVSIAPKPYTQSLSSVASTAHYTSPQKGLLEGGPPISPSAGETG